MSFFTLLCDAVAVMVTFYFLLQHFVLSVSLAYFLYDTVCCLLIDRDAANLLHHVFTCLGLAIGWLGQSGTELTLSLLLLEVRAYAFCKTASVVRFPAHILGNLSCSAYTQISNPFLHTRSLLRVRLHLAR